MQSTKLILSEESATSLNGIPILKYLASLKPQQRFSLNYNVLEISQEVLENLHPCTF